MTNQEKQLRKKNKDPYLKESPLTSAKAKGERLKRVRFLANLSREEFCSDGVINFTTLVSWEVGRFGGLTAKGAAKVIARIAKEGVFCTSEWLLYEIGAGPTVRADYKKANQPEEDYDEKDLEKSTSDETANIIEELVLFRKLNKHTIDFIIEDDGMLPHYQIGDYVAGTKRYGEKIKNLIGLNCIIQTKDGLLIMRNLQMGPRENSYNLVCTNLHSKNKQSIIYDVDLATAAPIIWHRAKEPR